LLQLLLLHSPPGGGPCTRPVRCIDGTLKLDVLERIEELLLHQATLNNVCGVPLLAGF
jgi:hypothetical protein